MIFTPILQIDLYNIKKEYFTLYQRHLMKDLEKKCKNGYLKSLRTIMEIRGQYRESVVIMWMLSANSQPVGSATLHGLQKQPSYFSFCSWLQPLETEYWQNRLRAVPIFPLEFVDQRKDIANTGARKSRQKSCFSFPRFPARKRSRRLSAAQRTQEEKIGPARSLRQNGIKTTWKRIVCLKTLCW